MRLREEVRNYVIEARLRERRELNWQKIEAKKEAAFLKKQEKHFTEAIKKASLPNPDRKIWTHDEIQKNPEGHKK